jgi:tRNA U55 pseudouridine synthase TruB
LDDITVPSKERQIYTLALLEFAQMPFIGLFNEVKNRISKIEGDFRQALIQVHWQEIFKESESATLFPRVRLRVSCSSGTYARVLVHELGQVLGTGAVTLQIIRTRIGDYDVKDALHLQIDT